MSRTERIWTDEEIVGMHQTMERLRQMRTAATMDVASWSFRYHEKFRKLFHLTALRHDAQEALLDAEALGSAAGEYLGAKFSRKPAGKREFQEWQDVLHDKTKQYELYGYTSSAGTSIEHCVNRSLIGRLRNLFIDPEYALHWDFVENNHLGAASVDECIAKKMGVFAPLSGDLLMAKVYDSYLRRTKGRGFPSAPVALNEDRTRVVLPDAGYERVFEDKPEIGIYLDTVQTGDTGRALHEHLMTLYPDKIVHAPSDERSDFILSPKMEAYWAKS